MATITVYSIQEVISAVVNNIFLQSIPFNPQFSP